MQTSIDSANCSGLVGGRVTLPRLQVLQRGAQQNCVVIREYLDQRMADHPFRVFSQD